jgi:hypothetical protein
MDWQLPRSTRSRDVEQTNTAPAIDRARAAAAGDLFLAHGGGADSFDRDLQERHQRRFK